MKKLALCLCGEVSKTCTANGCMKAFNNRSESFQRYVDMDVRLSAINTCNGCDNDPLVSMAAKIEKFKKAEVDVVHLSTCIRGRCDHYETFARMLSEDFDVIGYTHGSAGGKTGNSIDVLEGDIIRFSEVADHDLK